ncbi:Na+/H+ antiporter NhaC [Desulfovibrio porci]|uniref:Na+/H+ antiporter NhaC n=1 Tax=Desulfovibrio porci TaxID=2605782 RepID=UPI003A915CF7
MPQHKTPSFAFAVTTLLTIVALIAGGLIFFKLQLHLLMLTGWIVSAAFGKCLGFSYADLEAGAYELIMKAMGACLILMCVGALIGAWIAAGTVPVMIYVGLNIITPSLFLVTSLIVCSLTALATGTSWGTIGTVGVALMGIGAGLGFAPGLTAASIICGSFFGDKMSPLSDTTNMAAAVNGVPLLRHVKHMFFTITPAYVITFILYAILGFQHSGDISSGQLTTILNGLDSHFRIGVIPALPMLLVLILLLRRSNPVVAITSGALFGVAIAVLHGGMDLSTAFNTMWGGYKGQFEDPFLAKLLNRGGVTSMLNILCLVILACGLGGMLKRMGVIDAALDPLARRADTGFKLVGATLIIGYGTLMLTAAIYFSIVMTGTLMAPIFRKNGFRPENCSRVVEDASTLGGPLVPWANNALFPMATLSVTYAEYVPWVFLLYLTPVVSLLYAFFNITMTRLTPEEMAEEKKADLRQDSLAAAEEKR